MLVVCEGEVTEIEYLTGVRDYFRSLPVDVRSCRLVGLGKDPGSVVDYAIRERDKKAKEARAQKDANVAYDEVWCVVDVDDHKTLEGALSKARQNWINVAVSHPCFELWILYHFAECRAGCDGGALKSKIRKHLPTYDKHLGRDFPFDRYETARDRAQKADPRLTAPNSKGCNPSTNVWLLVDVIRRSGRS
ncbi:RloB family protein [Nonomuraea dietziae]|uniref:RloB family protein n=1 Tax=Nonomuraea dietziae TaxID=65515 RepID=UPI0033C76129